MNRRTLVILLAAGAGVVLLVITLAVVTTPPPSTSTQPPPADHVLAALLRARIAGDDFDMARAWLAMNDPVRAADALGPAGQGRSAPAVRLEADLAVQSGRWAEARVAFEQMLALDPNDTNAHLNLGLMLAAADPMAARAHLEATADDPALAPLARAVLNAARESAGAVGWVLLEQAQWPYAELALQTAAAGPAPHPVLLGALALAQDYQGRDGSRWMALALEAAPEDVSVLALAGMHLRLRGDVDGSLLAFATAAELAPESAPLLAQLGAAYQRAGSLEQARIWLERAVALAGDDGRYQALLDTVANTEETAFDALVDALDSGAAYGAP